MRASRASHERYQEATIGLVRALRRFDPHPRYRFPPTPRWIPPGSPGDCREEQHDPALPINLYRTPTKLKEGQRELEQELARSPSLSDAGGVVGAAAGEVERTALPRRGTR